MAILSMKVKNREQEELEFVCTIPISRFIVTTIKAMTKFHAVIYVRALYPFLSFSDTHEIVETIRSIND